jgi:putative transcriptional regulator
VDGASTAGRLLVATPALGDPNFERTVVLMLEHGDEGALGLVLNRPTPVDLASALPDWATFATAPAVVFLGGPVSQGAVIALARASVTGPSEVWTPVGDLDGVGVIDLGRDAVAHGVEVDGVRVFTGYSGWGPGQLESELDEGAWYVVDAETTDAFDEAPESLWSQVLRRQGGALGRVGLYPPDPSVN